MGGRHAGTEGHRGLDLCGQEQPLLRSWGLVPLRNNSAALLTWRPEALALGAELSGHIAAVACVEIVPHPNH